MKRHIVLVASLFLCLACRPGISVVGEIDALPEIFPDYSDVTVPVNIPRAESAGTSATYFPS